MLKPCVTCGRLTYRRVELTWQCDRCRLLTQNVPAEVWTEIFDHLDDQSLLNARLTSRGWKQLVDESPSLRRRLKVRIVGPEVTLDQNYNNVWLPPAAQIHIHVDRIISVDSWWPAFGAKLIVLELMDNYIQLETLFGMLSQTPLLKELILIGNKYLGERRVDLKFHLDDLEKLVLETCDRDSKIILELFCEIRPKFRHLAFRNVDREMAMKLVLAAQNTLKGLKWNANDEMYEAMSKLKNLQLLHVTMFINDPQLFGRFIQTQRNIDDLSINHENFQIISNFDHLNLVRLTLLVSKDCSISLGHMPNLKYLEIQAIFRRLKVNITDCSTPNLEEFRLVQISTNGSIVTNYLINCPTLHSLTFSDVDIDKAVNLAELPPRSFTSLKSLKIKGSNITRQQLLNLFRRCPMLEHVELKTVRKVNNEVVQLICKQLVHLKRLVVCGRLNDSSASSIIRYHGPNLRQLCFVDYGWNRTTAMERKLREHFSPWCSVQFCWANDAESYVRDLVRF